MFFSNSFKCVWVVVLFSSQLSFASGGFQCKAQTDLGQKLEISGGLPHSIVQSLTTDVKISLNDEDFMTIPLANVINFYRGQLESEYIFAFKAVDKNADKEVVDFVFKYKEGGEVEDGWTPATFSRLVIKDPKELSAKNVSCIFE